MKIPPEVFDILFDFVDTDATFIKLLLNRIKNQNTHSKKFSYKMNAKISSKLRADTAAQNMYEFFPELSGDSNMIDRIQFGMEANEVNPEIDSSKPPKFIQGSLKVFIDDPINIYGKLLFDEKERPLLVVESSHIQPGGRWLDGVSHQESSVMLRTTLNLQLSNISYPLESNSSVYAPEVYVFRQDMNSNFALVDPKKSFWMTTLCVNPANRKFMTPESHYEIIQSQIDYACSVAINRDFDTIIFSAFGLDRFGNTVDNLLCQYRNAYQKFKNHLNIVVAVNPYDYLNIPVRDINRMRLLSFEV